MNLKYLILTEGELTEPNFLVPLLEKYGFIVKKETKINVKIGEDFSDFNKIEFENDKDNVVLAQGPRNRIKELIKLFSNDHYDLEKFFCNSRDIFAGIFLLYDVDQTLKEDLENAYQKFNNEQDGMLLISSPCIEVLAHERNCLIEEVKCFHLSKEYKPIINKYISDNYHISISDYIYENFEKISLKYLEMNEKDFNSSNVLEHPQLVVNMVNELNDRHCNQDNIIEFTYRYFTTVIYVFFAYIMGLTKEIDNVETFKKFLKSNIKY